MTLPLHWAQQYHHWKKYYGQKLFLLKRRHITENTKKWPAAIKYPHVGSECLGASKPNGQMRNNAQLFTISNVSLSSSAKGEAISPAALVAVQSPFCVEGREQHFYSKCWWEVYFYWRQHECCTCDFYLRGWQHVSLVCGAQKSRANKRVWVDAAEPPRDISLALEGGRNVGVSSTFPRPTQAAPGWIHSMSQLYSHPLGLYPTTKRYKI